MVMRLEAQLALRPAGKPVAVPIPVAPIVVCVISVSSVFMHKLGVADATPAVLTEVTLMLPVASIDPHPPVRGMV